MPIHSLNAPVSGMRLAQRALTVTGHNMSNVNTPGFSRQRVNQSDHFYRSMGLTATNRKQVGLGTSVINIQQLRNQFLDQAFRHQVGRAHYYGTMWNTSNQIEAVMRELNPTGANQVSATRNIWNALQELTTNPHAIDHRVNFVSMARSYLDRTNDTFNRLQQQQQLLNSQIKDTVNRANELVRIIDNMNREIARVEVIGEAANDFRDARALAMEELSSILDVNITFNRHGHAEITTHGASLLQGGHITHIGLRYTGHGTNFVEPVVGHDVRPGSGTLAFDPTFRNAISILRFDRTPNPYERPGLLLGLVTSRGLGSTHHASQGAQNPYETDPNFAPLDAFALFQWQIRNEFNSNIAIIPRTIRHLDVSFNHMVTMLNEFITNQNASTDRSTWGFWNDPAADPDDATINMVTDPNRQQTGIPLFITRDPDLIQNADPSQNGFTLNYTLGNVVINPMLLAPGGYSYLGFGRTTLDIDDTTVLQNLLAAWQYNNVSLDGSLEMNVDNLLNHIISTLATETRALEDASFNQDHRVRRLDTDRQRSFAVSLDEELANMMRFQHSFNASARLINIIDGMIDTVVNRTGRL
ncbi:MAG: hypothetical protein FWF50_06010 [Defluviitaleaceae bacterium]|nr:hypothetical protein [Defluviitaleaceae bacterium]